MSNEGFILDTPGDIAAFALLQVYFKLKMEVEHPGGPTWRFSPRQQALTILDRAGIEPLDKRTKAGVLAAYKAHLEGIGVLREKS